MDSKQKIIDRLRGGLVVSCQALADEPLHSSYIMSRMAYAAMLGGAAGIRANTVEDIREIKKLVDLPVIGIIKRDYPGCDVYITPTPKEVDALAACGTEIIALDATDRPRPDGLALEGMFRKLRAKYPGQLFMADCSCYEEGVRAAELGFDFVGTTLSGYTAYTKGTELPNLALMKKLASTLPVPVIAEGGIWERGQLVEAMAQGVFCAVVGSAITRPMLITQRFAQAIKK